MDTDIIAAARLNLTLEKYPYLTYILYNLTPIPTPGLGTMAVDKWWRLYYDPELDWDVPTTAAVLYHEAGHIMRDHQARGVGYDHKLFNIAGDLEINDDVRAEGWKLPDWVWFPEKIGCEEGKLAEFYYHYIMENAKPCDGSCGEDGCEGISVPGPDGEGGCEHGKPQNGKDCGSIADGNKRDYEKDGGDGKKISEAEGELIRRQVAEDVQRQVETKGRGTVPAWMERWAEAYLNPKVDWRKELRVSITNAINHVAGNMDYSYRRPSRRANAIPNVVLPSMVSPEINAAIVIDTSGSMSQGNLEECLTECKGIIEASGTKCGVAVYAVDADVATAGRVFSVSEIELGGGGGTDMRVGIDAALDAQPKPDIIIVLTDGYTPWPDTEPTAKVIIGIVEGGSGEGAPPWAKVINMADEAA